MSAVRLETERLVLRKFGKGDMEALYLLLRDREVNAFLPWFAVNSMRETEEFYEKRFEGKMHYYAICLKQDDYPVGYIKMDMDDSHDFGYALRREFWGRGIVTEAGAALVERLKKDGIPYITATHDRNNPKSGNVMRRLGMKYCYSYREQWQPKDFLVTFRMYQLNLDGNEDRVYRKYMDNHAGFMEKDLSVHQKFPCGLKHDSPGRRAFSF
ncbi:MAG TPA: GNAT family N-acetyltransferase [Candidatus Mailhella excrementigallinarum]|nr:GNAT family N-acetyltransferase [Candidatus Mailhella excrementigallinarum]